MPCIVEVDDYPSRGAHVIRVLEDLRRDHPGLIATLYAVPARMTSHDWAMVMDRPWLRCGIHGIQHIKGECTRQRPLARLPARLGSVLGSGPWAPVFKPPHHGAGLGLAHILASLGLALAARNGRDLLGPRCSSLDLPPGLRLLRRDEPGPGNATCCGHPNGAGNVFLARTQAQWARQFAACPGFAWSHEAAAPLLNAYLCAGSHALPGFLGFDKHASGNTPWEWGLPVPLPDASCGMVLVQHGLMYAAPAMHLDAFRDMARLLCRGGTLLLKEDWSGRYQWRPVGHRGVACATDPRVAAGLALQAGLMPVLRPDGPEHWAGLLNRVHRLRTGRAYLFEAIKP